MKTPKSLHFNCIVIPIYTFVRNIFHGVRTLRRKTLRRKTLRQRTLRRSFTYLRLYGGVISKCRLYGGTLINADSTAELNNNDFYGGASLQFEFLYLLLMNNMIDRYDKSCNKHNQQILCSLLTSTVLKV